MTDPHMARKYYAFKLGDTGLRYDSAQFNLTPRNFNHNGALFVLPLQSLHKTL